MSAKVIRIVHLSDLHFKSTDRASQYQSKVISAVLASIPEDSCDFIFFTGDIVNRGDDSRAIDEVQSEVLKPLQEKLKDPANLILCQGNHDVHRGNEYKAIKQRIDSINDNDSLNEFVRDNGEFQNSLLNHGSFAGLNIALHPSSEDTDHQPLWSTYVREIGGTSIGIVALNSSWRSSSSTWDRGNLLFPTALLERAVQSVAKCPIRICIMHHGFAFFKEFNAAELEDAIHEHFHVLLTGHVHRTKNAAFLTHQEGIFHSTSAACLVGGVESGNLGYTRFELDPETYEVHVTVCRLVAQVVKQDATVSIAIPMQGIKQEQNELRKTIRKKYGQELLNASDLLIDDGGGKASFLDLFTEPALLRKSSLDTMSSGSRGHRVSLASLTFTTDAFLVLGKDKSGRTSLLKKIQLDLLHEFSQQGLLPYYVDCRTLRAETRPFNLVRRLSEYYEMSQARAETAITRHGVKLLLDNYHAADDSMNRELLRLLAEYPNLTFLATAEESLARNYESFEFGERKHTNLFLHNITRKDVRVLAKKWPNLPIDKRDEIIDKVDKLCRQLNLPLNYWTVSLFMWVFERNLGSKIQNNVELIQLYVDGMLDREKMIINRSEKIGFEDFKLYVSSVAHFLLTEHYETGYACSWLDLTQFTGRYIQENKKFVIGNEKVVRLMLDRGIVKEVAPDSYSFRLNGVFEYFLALYMNDHPDFKDEVLGDNRLYLSFGNELELYAGFNRLDEKFIKELLGRTREIFSTVNQRLGIGASVDANLRAKVESANSLIPGLLNNRTAERALSDEEKDEVMDEVRPIDVQTAEVERKRFFEGLDEDSEVLEQALRILARAYRASAIRSEALQNEVFDFVLDSACNLGFILIEETEAWRKEMDERRGEEFGRALLQMMTNFIPLLVQTFLNDWLAQPNLERIFNERIAALKENAGTNQYKLTILYLLLMDVDVRSIERRLPEAQQIIHERGLRFTVLLKLYFYLMFKSTPGSSLEKFLVHAIEQEQANLNPNFDKRKLTKMLTERLRQKRGTS